MEEVTTAALSHEIKTLTMSLRKLAVATAGFSLFVAYREQPRWSARSAPKESVVCLERQEGLEAPVRALGTRIRDKTCPQDEFVLCVDRALQLVLEVALGKLAASDCTCKVETTTGKVFEGFALTSSVAAVSILRSGDSFNQVFSKLMPRSPTGKLLVAKHESEELRVLYSKLPRNLGQHHVLLMDPLLATGSTMIKAMQVLTEEYDVDPSNITVVSLIAVPKGIENVRKRFPQTTIITACIDPGLDEHGFISPGLGSFGDRYFGSN